MSTVEILCRIKCWQVSTKNSQVSLVHSSFIICQKVQESLITIKLQAFLKVERDHGDCFFLPKWGCNPYYQSNHNVISGSLQIYIGVIVLALDGLVLKIKGGYIFIWKPTVIVYFRRINAYISILVILIVRHMYLYVLLL
jgi:hypothetical protein